MNTSDIRYSMKLASRLLYGTAFATLSASAVYAQGTAIESVTVTGTSIRGSGPVGSNLITIGPADIEQSNSLTVSQLLTSVPDLNNFEGAGQSGNNGVNSSDAGGSQTPTIHSLGNSASNGTLILMDGHRLPYTGVNHSLVDPSSIPVQALARVEILPDGASAIYGSDAVAGVLNFVTRKDYSGLDMNVDFGTAPNYQTADAGVLFGHNWGSGSVMAAYNYSSKSELGSEARSFETPRQDIRMGVMANPTAFAPSISTTPPTGFLATTPAAGQGTTGPFGATVPYPSLGSNFQTFNCPTATERTATKGSTSFLYPYTATSGITNNTTPGNGVCDNQPYSTDLGSETRNTFFVSLKQQITEDLVFSTTLDFSSRYSGFRNPYGTLADVTVFGPTSGRGTQINPFYTSGTTGLGTSSLNVSYDFQQLLAGQPQPLQKETDTTAYMTTGLDWDMGHDWAGKVGATFGIDLAGSRTQNALCVACANLALNGTTNVAGSANLTPATSAIIDPDGLGTVLSQTRALTTSNALDVWHPAGSTNLTSASVLRELASGYNNITGQQGMQDVSFTFDGPVFDLPAGPIRTALGGEYTHTTATMRNNSAQGGAGPSSIISSTQNLLFGRSVYAAFAEILIPVVSPEMNVPLVQKFEIDTSARYDDYTIFGSTKNPKVGFTWDIIDGMKARGSFGTSFTVPAYGSAGEPGTGITSQSSVGSGGTPSIPIPFNNTTYNGGAGVAGTWVGSAATCAAAGSNPVDANGNNVTVAPYTGAVACKINATNDPGIQYAAGGQPGIKPEIGMSYSAGFDLDFGKLIGALDGLTVTATYYQAKYAGMVTSIGLQTSLPGLTYFAPPGGWSPSAPFITDKLSVYPLTASLPSAIWSFFDGRQTNAYTLWNNGIDYAVRYRLDTDIGLWTMGISGNEILRDTQQNGSTPILLDIKNGKNAGRFVAQEMTWRANVNWHLDPYTIGLALGFQSPFNFVNTNFPYSLAGPGRLAGNEHIGPLMVLDLNASYNIPSTWLKELEGTQLGLNVTNLLDTKPPFVDTSAGFNTGSQIGRLVLVSLKKSW